tara:strand:+ start:635 stop:1897 length:1263 start_codon:yes stop_codon:yes gene_type:complete
MAFKMRSGNKTSFKKMGSSGFKKDPPIDQISRITKEKAYEDETGKDYATSEDMGDLKETDMTELQKQEGKKQNIFRQVFKPKTTVLDIDSEKQQQRRQKLDEEGQLDGPRVDSNKGSRRRTKGYDIIDEEGNKKRVHFKNQEDADKYFRNIDKETGKQINPGDVAATTGEPVQETELSKLESDDYRVEDGKIIDKSDEEAQKLIDSGTFKGHWAGTKGEVGSGRQNMDDVHGTAKSDFDPSRQKQDLKHYQDLGSYDEKTGKFSIPEWRQREIKDQYASAENEKKADAEQEIRDLAKESDKTGVTKDTDFSFDEKLDPKYHDSKRRLVLDESTGNIKEQAERKGKYNPVKLFSKYKDTGREKTDERWGKTVDELEAKNKKKKKKPTKEEKKKQKEKKKQNKKNPELIWDGNNWVKNPNRV